MGVRNLRAICPNCGAKIHTQPKGLGHITWANSWINVQTGKECPSCGVALTGKVKSDNRAELAGGTSTTIGGFVKTNGAGPTMKSAVRPASCEGWWPDPAGRYHQRYFDGANWTWRVKNDNDVAVDPQGALH